MRHRGDRKAAIRAGCRSYYGYPITPPSEIPEYSRLLPQVGGTFFRRRARSRPSTWSTAPASAGVRVMTCSAAPASASCRGPRTWPGASSPRHRQHHARRPRARQHPAAQSDYFADERAAVTATIETFVLAPSTVQETVALTTLAFDLADEYRNPWFVLGDGLVGQMMEPVTFAEDEPRAPTSRGRSRAKPRPGRTSSAPSTLTPTRWRSTFAS